MDNEVRSVGRWGTCDGLYGTEEVVKMQAGWLNGDRKTKLAKWLNMGSLNYDKGRGTETGNKLPAVRLERAQLHLS
ncbi:MAG: hypothetical protein A3H45_12440 [Ignavibacteria bacterium RIFCSPLOWO2_02_FULL_55_14]|nr:MAG: hypothetical protein A3H45_12440 [Ignavibacteria bacterium RIFCSPLOWO2_02_FULL_55_14]OGU76563.1 MAG: hypothetical protein A3G43_04570 [Ignavibacteria bacterium RIFCSPLOWO2_12_FULL_56_21]